MSLVQPNQTIDDTYSAEIIAKARSLSAEIEEYVVTQQYLTEVDDADVVPDGHSARIVFRHSVGGILGIAFYVVF